MLKPQNFRNLTLSLTFTTLDFNKGTAAWLACNKTDKEIANGIHFATANGFAASTYLPFLNLLNEHYAVSSMDNRGAWNPRNKPPFFFGMPGFANDWIKGIRKNLKEPVIGVGHSHGAQVTLAAALQAPELFTKLILIEPATLPYAYLDNIYRFIPKHLMHGLFPFIRRTSARQKVWPSREAFSKRYQNHPTFRLFTDESFKAYVKHGLRATNNGEFELVFDPIWESYIFRKIRFLWFYLEKTQHPTLLIRGAQSTLISNETFTKHNSRLNNNVDVIELENAHHLLPQEQPERIAKIIHDWLGGS